MAVAEIKDVYKNKVDADLKTVPGYPEKESPPILRLVGYLY